ncbi:hypothetical protein HanXRQr2_Chr14g0643941 [Helianthus annuus]|uniref:Uncharacterized protein n=1 Tax=Helianthus annuus TaxID=4232 RepID=A0A9K3E8U0_HELAN|nr:hypothetical protein HanXRQr2_Chr14g0643941 [Helianthus annuus]KAJ0840365.1 hypothetical protein HanPSC8_Chr14g0617821 [Helianthus annuus]
MISAFPFLDRPLINRIPYYARFLFRVNHETTYINDTLIAHLDTFTSPTTRFYTSPE